VNFERNCEKGKQEKQLVDKIIGLKKKWLRFSFSRILGNLVVALLFQVTSSRKLSRKTKALRHWLGVKDDIRNWVLENQKDWSFAESKILKQLKSPEYFVPTRKSKTNGLCNAFTTLKKLGYF
jgi:hypothetical protein